MKKLAVVGAAGLAAAGAWILLSTGVAGAEPDVSGKTYTDAQKALKDAGYQAVVSTAIGDTVSQGDCKVIRQATTTASPFVGGDVHAASSKPKVMLSLDCTSKPASESKH